jgi:hypothetical protein
MNAQRTERFLPMGTSIADSGSMDVHPPGSAEFSFLHCPVPTLMGTQDVEVIEIRKKSTVKGATDFVLQKDWDGTMHLQEQGHVRDQRRSYEIETILRSRMRNGQLEFLIKWVGYPQSENTWSVRADLDDPWMVDEFLERERTKRSRASASSDTIKAKKRSEPVQEAMVVDTAQRDTSKKRSRTSPIVME